MTNDIRYIQREITQLMCDTCREDILVLRHHRINVDVSLTYNIYNNFYKENPHPIKKGVLGHWIVSYYGEESRSTRKTPLLMY